MVGSSGTATGPSPTSAANSATVVAAVFMNHILSEFWLPEERRQLLAEVFRILMVELNRIGNHLWALGFLLNDLGALQTPMLLSLIHI